MTQETIDAKKPTTFSSPFADTGDKNTIAASGTDVANMATGFPSIFSTPRANSGKSVARKDMNGILNAVSSLNYYFQYMGRNPWVSGTSYPKGAKAWYSNAEYVSTADNNTTTPGATGASWIKLNDLSGTSGGSTVSCLWDADKIASIINYLSTLDTLVKNVYKRVDSINIATNGQYTLSNSDVYEYVTKSTSSSTTNPQKTLVYAGWILPPGLTYTASSSTYWMNCTDFQAIVKIQGQAFTLPLPTTRLPAGTEIYSVFAINESSSTSGDTSTDYVVKYDTTDMEFSETPAVRTYSVNMYGTPPTTVDPTSTSLNWIQATTPSKSAKFSIEIPEYTGSGYRKFRVATGISGKKPGLQYFYQGTWNGVTYLNSSIDIYLSANQYFSLTCSSTLSVTINDYTATT